MRQIFVSFEMFLAVSVIVLVSVGTYNVYDINTSSFVYGAPDSPSAGAAAKFDSSFYDTVQTLVKQESYNDRLRSVVHYYDVVLTVARYDAHGNDISAEQKEIVVEKLNEIGARNIVAGKNLLFVLASIPVGTILDFSLHDEVYGLGDGQIRGNLTINTSRMTVNAEQVDLLEPDGTMLDVSDVIVAVIDSGITHPTVNEAVIGRATCPSNSPCYETDSVYGAPDSGTTHGSMVAHVIGGRNHTSGLGIASGVSLLDAHFIDLNISFLYSALDWAISKEADVANISISYGLCDDGSSTDNLIVNDAVNQGIVITKSAGNYGSFGSIMSPGCASNLLTVGGINDRGTNIVMYGQSSKGPYYSNGHPILKPDIVAPGYKINLVHNDDKTKTRPVTGTSFSSPHVAAAAAMLIGKDETMQANEVKAALLLGANWTGPIPCTSVQYERYTSGDNCSHSRQPNKYSVANGHSSLKILNNVGFGILDVRRSLEYISQEGSSHVIAGNISNGEIIRYAFNITDTAEPVKTLLTWMKHSPAIRDFNTISISDTSYPSNLDLVVICPGIGVMDAGSDYQNNEFAVFMPNQTGTCIVDVTASSIDLHVTLQEYVIASTHPLVPVNIAPIITSIERFDPESEVTSSQSLLFRANFNYPVTGVDLDDFMLSPDSTMESKQFTQTREVLLPIPDEGAAIYDTIAVADSGDILSVSVDVDITHTHIGNLMVDLLAPDGTIVNLHERTGGGSDDINQTYEPAFDGAGLAGDWVLRVRDMSDQEIGTLNEWTLTIEYKESIDAVVGLTGSGSQYFVSVLALRDGTYNLDIVSDSGIIYVAGNPLNGTDLADSDHSYVVETGSPEVVSIKRSDQIIRPANYHSLVFGVNFSEPVRGVDAADFVLSPDDGRALRNFTQTMTPSLPIPDNGAAVFDAVTISSSGTVRSVSVDVDISHTFISDLSVALIAPDGTIALLHNRAGANSHDIHQTYTPNLADISLKGNWTLRMNDAGPADTGTLNEWTLSIKYDEADSTLTGSGSRYLVTVPAAQSGTYNLDIVPNNGISDLAGNPLAGDDPPVDQSFQVEITDYVPITVDAGLDQIVMGGQMVALNGTAAAIDGDPLTYLWTHNSTLVIQFTNSTSPSTTFTAPYVSSNTTLTLTLTADDGTAEVSDSVDILIMSTQNVHPVLDVIQEQAVDEMSTLIFVARATDEDLPSDTLTYGLEDPPAGALMDPATGAFTWTPTEDQNGIHTITVTVSDGNGGTDSQEVQVTVNVVNVAPTVDAGEDFRVLDRSEVTLSGTVSDADGDDTVTYSWSQIGGTLDVVLTGSDTLTPTFTAPDVSSDVELTFQLTADDNINTVTDTVIVTVHDSAADFVTTWKTTSASEFVRIPLGVHPGKTVMIDWGDGSNSAVTFNGMTSHKYLNPGEYKVTMTGGLARIHATYYSTPTHLTSIDQWGDIRWSTMKSAFQYALNMEYKATDIPDLSGVSSMDSMFHSASKFNGDLSGWNVSSVTDMDQVFSQASLFNRDISTWDVSSVTSMNGMFSGAASFNSPLNSWDVSSVTNMGGMFSNADAFNSSLNSWDVSSVTDMNYMFYNADAFNSPLNSWDVSSVTDMRSMFYNAGAFNSPLNSWNVSSVTDMNYMFRDTATFNQSLNSWNVSSVTDMHYMFYNADAFNSSLNSWDVSSVTDMRSMFYNADAFNSPLNSWDVSSVTDMHSMFYNADAFNQSLNTWDVSSVTDMHSMFYNAATFNQSLNTWDVSSVTDMHSMFYNAATFNSPLNTWDVSSVTDMHSMFRYAAAFNSSLNSWDVSSAAYMGNMFLNATAFDQNLGGWYVVPDNVSIARSDVPGIVGVISAQNLVLDGHSPTYSIGIGGDSAFFEIANGNDLKMTSVEAKSEYKVNVTASGLGIFEDGNNWRMVEVTVSGQGNSPPTVDAGVDQDATEGSVVILNATVVDADTDSLTYAWSHDSALIIQLTNSASPSTTFAAPAVDADTAVTFTLTVDDGTTITTDSLVVTITDIPAVNSTPVVDAGHDQIVLEGSIVTLTATATDADDNQLAHTWTYHPLLNLTLTHATTTSSWFTAPDVNANTTITFTLTADDGTAEVSDSVDILIMPTQNVHPVLDVILEQAVDEMSTLIFVARATDEDLPSDTLTYGLEDPPVGASMNPATGAFTWTPTEDQNGIRTVTVTVSDGRGGTDSQDVQVTVNEVNMPPTLDVIPAQTIDELAMLTFTVNASDDDLHPGVGIEVVAGKLKIPWSIDWTPDWTALFTERGGDLRIIRDGILLPDPIFSVDVNDDAEGGLLGIAVDPEFEENQYIYMYQTYKTDGTTLNKVVRYTLANVTVSEDLVLVDGIPGASYHDGGRIQFGPDGNLYITTGDAGNPSLAQDLDSLAGKILRITREGAIPQDNPFSNSAVWSWGHRNPQGMDWDGSGNLIATEHGPSGERGEAHDEINLILPGANYGWPETVGDESMAGMQDPLLHTGSETWAPSGSEFYDGDMIPGWTGKYFVANLRGEHLRMIDLDLSNNGTHSHEGLFEGQFGRLRDVQTGPDGFLYLLTSNRDGRGSPVSNDDRILKIVPVFDSALSRPANVLTYGLEASPAGASMDPATGTFTWRPAEDQNGIHTITVTVSDGNGGTNSQEVQVTVNEVNVAPIVDAGSDQTALEGQTVMLNGTATDADGDSLTYLWSHNSSLAIQLANSTSPSTTFAAPAVDADTAVTFTLTVDDGTTTATDSFEVTVTDIQILNSPPVADAGSDQTALEGQTVMLNGTATDADGDSLTYLWSHNSSLAIQLANSTSPSTTFAAPAVDADTEITFTLTVNDGLTDSTDTVLVTVNDVPDDSDFVTTWETVLPGESITIPARGTYTIDWGDGTVDARVTRDQTHTYADPGNHTVRISKDITGIYLNNHADAPNLRSIDQWGDAEWRSIYSSFMGASNMVLHATDAPDLSRVTNTSYMFLNASSFDGDLSAWDLSHVASMTGMFWGASSFDGDISSWNVSAVTNMNSMFQYASTFNGDISSWNVSAVTDMNYMFSDASTFNGDISDWDVSAVTDMHRMFHSAFKFNQPLNSWNVSSVTNMSYMFLHASEFNQPLNSWNVSAVTDIPSMFFGASVFNGDISDWDVSAVTDMRRMFHSAFKFNQPLNSWNVSSVTNMSDMFLNADDFEQNLGKWYVVPEDTDYDAATETTLVVTAIATQNFFLNGHSPNYGIGTGGNSTLFSMPGSNLTFKDTTPSAGAYTVNVTASGSSVFERGNNWRTLTVTVTGQEDRPLSVDAGPDQRVLDESTVTLSGTVSDSTNPTYLWTQNPGSPAVTLAGPDTLMPTFTAPDVSSDVDLVFTLTVDDGTDTVTDTVTVTVHDAEADFVTTWSDIDIGINLPIRSSAGSFTVDWGDGKISEYAAIATDSNLHHNYDTSGTYTIRISGNFSGIYLHGNSDTAGKLQSIDQWGDIEWTTMAGAFYFASNMIYNATDVPDLSSVTDMSYMFYTAGFSSGDLSGWNVSAVTDMSYMFSGASSFNGYISSWNVSAVTNMNSMFDGASSFEQNLGNWYIMLDNASVTGILQTVGNITTQNEFLATQGPTYGIGSSSDSEHFGINGTALVLTTIPDANPALVNITSTGDFGTSNSRIFEITFSSGVVDITNPRLESIERYSPASQNTNSQSLIYEATFSESVTGVTSSDFILSPDSTGGGTTTTTSAEQFTQTRSPNLAIPDLQTVSDTITVSDSGTVTSVSVAVDITHTYIGDLKIDLIAPDGTTKILHNRSDGSDDDIVKTYTPNFDGVSIAGVWTLQINDNYNADPGTLNSWTLTINHGSTATTVNPVTGVSGSDDTYYVTVSSSTDGTYNLDLVSSGHSIADSASNPLTNTVPTGADEIYIVSTTAIDITNPRLESIERYSPASQNTNSQSLIYEATFSESVTGVTSSDFILSPDSTGGGTTTTSAEQFTQTRSPNLAIPDLQTVSDTITVSDSGTVTSVSVAVDITHTYIGDLKIDLIAPDGTTKILHNRSDGSDDDIVKTYTPNFDGVSIAGVWTLQINDNYNADPGTLNSWTLTINHGSTATTVNPVTGVSGSDDTYYVTVSSSTDGTYNLDLVSSGHSIADSAGNSMINTAPTGADQTYTVSITVTDTANPRLASIERYSPASQNTDSQTLVYKATFSESVTGVTASDFVLSPDSTGGINSVNPVTDISGSGDTYYVTVSSSTDGTYNLDLVSSGHSIADSAGNSMINTAPTGADQTYTVSITVTDTANPRLASIERYSPASQNTDSQTLVYKATFSESVTGVTSSDFILSPDSTGGGTTTTTSAEQFTQTRSPNLAIPDLQTVSDTITVSDSGTVTSVSVAVDITHTYIGDLKIDLIAPDGTTKILHNRSDGSDDDIVKTYTPNFDGVSIAGVWTLQINDNYNADPGTLNSWTLTINHGSTATTVNPVTGVSGSDDTYYVTVSSSTDGTYNLDLVSSGHSIADSAGNSMINTAPTGADQTYTVSITVTDTANPRLASIERYSPASQNTDSQTLVYKATFSESVTGVTASDFVLSPDSTGGINSVNPVTDISGSGDTYYVTVSSSTDGTYNLDLVSSGHSIADSAGNSMINTAPTGADQTYTVSITVTDTANPRLASIERYSPASQNTDSQTLVYKATFSESVTGVTASDFVLSPGSTGGINGVNPVTDISGSGDAYYVTVSATQDGTYNLDLVSSGHGIEDAASNSLTNVSPTGADETYTVSTTVADNTNPRLESIERHTPATANTDSQTLVYKATFSEDVAGVTASDFTLSPDSAGGENTTASTGQFTQTRSPNLDIPDLATVSDTITVPDSETATSVLVEVDITHDYINDLKIDIIAPDGTSITLHNNSGGNANNIDKSYAPQFGSIPISGVWTLQIHDNYNADPGVLNSWTLTINYGDTATTLSSVTDISGSGDAYYVTVSATQDGTYNLDLVSSGHGIEDAASNSLTNVSPTGADETYTVSTTVADNTNPRLESIERHTPATANTDSQTLVYKATFSEDVAGVTASDFTLSPDSAGGENTTASTGQFTQTRSPNLDIPDLATVSDTITVPDSETATSVLVEVDITHDYINDLKIDIIAPDGTSITLHNNSGGNANNIDKSYAPQFGSIPISGVWTLQIHDNYNADPGVLNSWTLTINYGDTATTLSSVTDISGSGDAYYVTVSATQDGTYNLDLVSSGHGIEDAASNSLTNVSPTGADETYTVSTTVADNTNPRLESIERHTPATANTDSQTLVYKATFSEDVAGVTASDFTLSPDSAGGENTTASTGQFTQTRSPNLDIPDLATVSDTITVPDSETATSVLVEVDITHDYINDLKIDIIAPDGTSITLHNNSGGNANNIDKSYAPQFGSIPISGVWTLQIHDNYNADPGVLNSWTLTINYGDTATTLSSVTDISGSGDAYYVTVSATQDGTYNLDLVSSGHGIEDAASNSLTNVSPTGADETYTVSTTVADNTNPRLESIERHTPATANTDSQTLVYKATFSEDVAGVTASDFTLSPDSAGGENTTASTGQFTQTRSPNLDIPDLATVSDTITVPDSETATSVLVEVDITHDYINDLKIDIIAPDGTSITLHNNSGGNANNIDKSYAPQFGSIPISGVWTLQIHDNYNADPGVLNSWTLTINYGDTATTLSSVTDISGSGDAYYVTVSATQDGTYNLDLVSSGHGIEDAASNSLTNVSPTGADETYTVSTTVADNTNPRLESIERHTPATANTDSQTLVYKATFSEDVAGVTASDFTLSPDSAGGENTTASTGQFTQTRSPNLDIPDLATVSDTITVPDSETATSVLVEVDITHDYINDLKIDIIAPDGTSITLHNNSGGNANNIDKSYAPQFGSIPISGVWTLQIHDNYNADPGVLNSWTLTINYGDTATTLSSVTDISGSGDAYYVTVSATQDGTYNLDLVSSGHGIEDAASNSLTNTTPTETDETYTVTAN